MTPEQVSYGSSIQVHWKCERGHSFLKSPKERRRSGCTICSNRTIIASENSIAATHPELLKTHDSHKADNPDLTTISIGTNKAVQWKCSSGHTTIATPRAWLSTRCPVCSNKRTQSGVNDILTTNPALGLQFDFDKNYPLTPEELTEGSNKKIWWICSEGHSTQSTPNDRRNHRCGVCAGRIIISGLNDLLTMAPEIASEWHPDRNLPTLPEAVHPGSHAVFWWSCVEGHEWQASPGSRQQNGCPDCARYGFKSYESAHLYFLHHPEFRAIKVGITGHKTTRIEKFQASGWRVLEKVFFERGADAVILRPKSTNKEHKPIVLTDNCIIQGVVQAVLPSDIY